MMFACMINKYPPIMVTGRWHYIGSRWELCMICYPPSMPCYPHILEGAYNLADLPTEALNCEKVQPIYSSPTFPDQYWLQRWIHLIRTSPHTPRVPPDACHITTPLIVTAWRHLLLGHSHRDLVHFLLTELSQGFRLGYTQTTSTLKSARRNMHSALFHPEVVDQYLPAQLAEHQLWASNLDINLGF